MQNRAKEGSTKANMRKRAFQRDPMRQRPKRLADLEEVRLNAAIARQIYSLRTKARLTQKQLAESRRYYRFSYLARV